ncbi:MAG: hypothetical protein Q9227_008928 [Pyrenula ochraceoflavens]
MDAYRARRVIVSGFPSFKDTRPLSTPNSLHKQVYTTKASALPSDKLDDMNASIFSPPPPSALPFFQSLAPLHNQQPYSSRYPSPLQTCRNVNLMPQSPHEPTSKQPSRCHPASKPRPAPSAAAQLSRVISSRRDSRQTAHRERALGRREDAYLQDRSDQVSRMEWMREQRMWEEDKRRRGQEEIPVLEEVEEDEMDQDDAEGRNGGASPQLEAEEQMMPTEDAEIEALVSYIESEGHQQSPPLGLEAEAYKDDRDRRAEDVMEDHASMTSSGGYGSEDEDYDQLFMDVWNMGGALASDAFDQREAPISSAEMKGEDERSADDMEI